MTLCSDIQFKFDRLDLWFVETPEPHRYKLEVAYPKASPGLPKYVTFTTPDKDKLPLPSPAFLKLHAACCKIARLSGASKYVWKFYTDMKDTHVLAHDGSTARLLEEALLYTPSRPRLFETADTLSWLISVNPLSKQVIQLNYGNHILKSFLNTFNYMLPSIREASGKVVGRHEFVPVPS